MKDFWTGFEKQAGVWNSIATSGVGQAIGLRHLTSGVRQVNKLHAGGHIGGEFGKATNFYNPARQSQVAAAGKNLAEGAARLGGTALAAGGAAYAGKKLLGGSQPAQQPAAAMPAYH